MEYATIESRLATFEPSAKRSKLTWPHKTPTPSDLAHAGFYYKPSKSSNDNTICYLCESQLGGWEPDDDPLEEHLKHSRECGWAIVMHAAQDAKQDTDNIEDPTGELLANARRATFSIGWPHESKRAWKCKTERMVEAGWHFAPVTDGEDYVSCAYCKLSLDGWEPKDDPFVEHHRRSPDCLFFQFAGTTAPAKRPKAKKGRASKASRTSEASTRLSTQSHTQETSIMSEAASVVIDDIPDLEDSIDGSEMSSMSIMSVVSTASTATTKGKRKAAGSRAKMTKSKKTKSARSTKTKKVEPEAEPDNEQTQENAPNPAAEEQAFAPVEVEEAAPVDEPEVQRYQPLPSPSPTPPLEVAYPEIPAQNTPLGISNSPRIFSPVAAQDNSPTPVKPKSVRTSLASAKKPTPRSTRTTPFNAEVTVPQASSPMQPQQDQGSSHTLSPSTSDIENAPPSTRSPQSRPPVPTSSASPLPTNANAAATKATIRIANSPAQLMPQWQPSDLELIFAQNTPAKVENELLLGLTGAKLSTPEQEMTVQEWLEFIATKAEEGLRSEAERVVGIFEREGQRAMGVLEAMTCV